MKLLNENEVKEKRFLTLNEMMVKYKNTPKTNYLWNGIKEKSFGLVFGPSKSGKTIFCENLAMNISMGKTDFFGYQLDGIPKKVLFVGLEEFWRNRTERNQMQFQAMNEQEQRLLGENYRFQPIDFSKRIVGKTDYSNLIKTIRASEAEVVFIDSITRMNLGQLENSADAERLMQKLRDICDSLKITLICIHHTPKIGNEAITMDKIKGSAVFAQESDFAIGINCTSKKNRYIKNVFFRYAADDDEKVKEFVIDSNCWLNYVEEVYEDELIARTDKRRINNKSDVIVNYLNENSSLTFSKQELFSNVSGILAVKERQYGYYLKDLEQKKRIKSPKLGYYTSVNYKNEEDGERK